MLNFAAFKPCRQMRIAQVRMPRSKEINNTAVTASGLWKHARNLAFVMV